MKKFLLIILVFAQQALAMDRWQSWAEITGEDSSGESPVSARKELIPKELALNKELRQAIKGATYQENIDYIVQFLAQGGDVERVIDEDSNYRLLEYACDHNQLEVCRLLIAAGASVNGANGDMTPLMMAHHELMTKLLIDAGADVNARDTDGKTPLFYAENIKQYQLLLQAGADINAADTNGFTALISHILANDQEPCEFLISQGASLHIKTKLGDTPLLDAAFMQNEELCALIIEQQKKHTQGMIIALLYLKHAGSPCATLLYRQRSKLLKPHLENYTLKALLNARDNNCQRAYNYLKVDFLKPADYANEDEPLDSLLASYLDFERPSLLQGDDKMEKIWHL